jgi:thiopurine S-methyltransferase
LEPSFWLERWQKNEIGFHAEAVQPALIKHWPALGVAEGARVLVPLCGKSLDMLWLAQQGLHVAGAELSAIAVRDFFAEHGITPKVREHGGFEVSTADAIELWCGDFFALDARAMNVTAAYDRAALVALPPSMQQRYAAKMAELMPRASKVLLISLDYDPQEMQGPPHNISQDRVRELFADKFEVALLEALRGPPRTDHLRNRGVTWLEEASYLLVRK